MSRFENILKASRAGALNQMSAEFEVACEITPESIATIMAQLPPELLEGLSRWKFEEPYLIVGSNMSPATEKTCREKLDGARPALRDWFARNQSRLNGCAEATSAKREVIEN